MARAGGRALARLQERLGEQVFRDARRDLLAGTFRSRRTVPFLARCLSILILALPAILVAAGLGLALLDFPNLMFLVIGATCVGAGWATLPRRDRNREATFRRSDLPAFFELADAIGDRLGGIRIDGMHISREYNAYLANFPDENILGVGLVLWAALTPEEQVALIAHELAHQQNGDPSRNGLLRRALLVLGQWNWYLRADQYCDHDGNLRSAEPLGSELALMIPRALLEGVEFLLERMVFAEQQRAEYLADALAAEVSGVPAAKALLEKLSLSDLVQAEWHGLSAIHSKGGKALVRQLSSAGERAPEPVRAAALERVRAERLAVDAPHPPSIYRQAFLDALSPKAPPYAPAADLFGRIEAELAPHLERVGNEILMSVRRD